MVLQFSHNSYRDALIISVADTLTSLLAGFVIFSILGNLAYELGVPVKANILAKRWIELPPFCRMLLTPGQDWRL